MSDTDFSLETTARRTDPVPPRRRSRRIAALGILAFSASLASGAAWLGRSQESLPAFVAWTQGARLLDQEGIRQRQANDCGPAALAHALRQIGIAAPYPNASLVPGEDGCRMDDIDREASRLGASSRLRHLPTSALESVGVPAVLHLRRGHYVVLEGRTRSGGFVLHDPSLGRIEQSRSVVAEQWSGWVLELAPPQHQLHEFDRDGGDEVRDLARTQQIEARP